jgi:hypothetical protein
MADARVDAHFTIRGAHPDNPRVLHKVGGAYDTAGDE